MNFLKISDPVICNHLTKSQSDHKYNFSMHGHNLSVQRVEYNVQC